MARGTQHRKRRPRADAVAAAPLAHRAKPKTPQWQEELFFQRLRNHAKWIYVGLAVTFVLGFVLLGVGSGSTGIGDALQGAFNFGSSGGTSISKLQSRVAKDVTDAASWRGLATAYEQKQRTSDAVDALEHLSSLEPKNRNVLEELASQYTTLADQYSTAYSDAQTAAQLASPSAAFTPPASTQLGKAFADPKALEDPISAAVAAAANTKATDAYTQLQSTATKAETVYQQLASSAPTDATLQLQLGQAAQTAGDSTTAIAAYKKFLKLAPTDPLASQVKQVIKSLSVSATTQTTSG